MRQLIFIAVGLAWATVEAAVPPRAPPDLPMAELPAKTICVIENPEVRPEFLDAYRTALAERGLNVAVLRQPEHIYDCPMTSTYVAIWRPGAYSAFIQSVEYAKLSVYRNGQLLGYTTFVRPNEYVVRKASSVLKDMVDKLMPGQLP